MLLKDEKCWKGENQPKVFTQQEKMENVGKTEILLKYGKCWKDTNVGKMRKMLERRKFC